MKLKEFMALAYGDKVQMGETGTLYQVSHVGEVQLGGAFAPVERDILFRSLEQANIVLQIAENDKASIVLLIRR